MVAAQAPNPKAIITAAAESHGIDPALLWGVFGTETSFGKNVQTSSAGAVGPLQLEPETARSLGVRNPNDLAEAANGAAKYLAEFKSRGTGGMLSAYNAGPDGGYQPDYVNTTLANAKTYGAASTTPIGAPLGVPKAATVQAAPSAEAAKAAERRVSLDRFVAGSFGDSPLRSVLDLSMPTASASTVGKLPAAAAPSAATGYVNPLPHGFTQGRTDMGVDFSATPGAPILAIGNARILEIQRNWYQGQPLVSYELLDGPQKGKVVYVAEQITPHVNVGDQVKAGQQIGSYAPSGTGIEMGFGTRTGQTLAQESGNTGDATHGNAPAGQQFESFLRELGAATGQQAVHPNAVVAPSHGTVVASYRSPTGEPRAIVHHANGRLQHVATPLPVGHQYQPGEILGAPLAQQGPR